jgi:hypothetical protein
MDRCIVYDTDKNLFTLYMVVVCFVASGLFVTAVYMLVHVAFSHGPRLLLQCQSIISILISHQPQSIAEEHVEHHETLCLCEPLLAW